MKLTSFKKFLVEEPSSIHPKDAVSYFSYTKNDHLKVSSNIKKEICRKWQNLVLKKSKDMPEDADVSEVISFEDDEKLIGKSGHKFMAAVCVTIGSDIDKNTSLSMQKTLLKDAYDILVKYKDTMNSKESRKPFIVTKDDDDLSNVRLKFSSGDVTKSIFICGIDHSVKYTRIYLRDLI